MWGYRQRNRTRRFLAWLYRSKRFVIEPRDYPASRRLPEGRADLRASPRLASNAKIIKNLRPSALIPHAEAVARRGSPDLLDLSLFCWVVIFILSCSLLSYLPMRIILNVNILLHFILKRVYRTIYGLPDQTAIAPLNKMLLI